MPKAKKKICRYQQQYANSRGDAGADKIAGRFITRAKGKVAAIVRGEVYLNRRPLSARDAKARKRALMDALCGNYFSRPEFMERLVEGRDPAAIVRSLSDMNATTKKIRRWYAAASESAPHGEIEATSKIRNIENAIKAAFLMGGRAVTFCQLETLLRDREQTLRPFERALEKLEAMLQSRKRRVEELSEDRQKTIDLVVHRCRRSLEHCEAICQTVSRRRDEPAASEQKDDASTLQDFRVFVTGRIREILSVAENEKRLAESGTPSMKTTAVSLMERAADSFEPQRIDQIVRACWTRTRQLAWVSERVKDAYLELMERRDRVCEPVPPPFQYSLPFYVQESLREIVCLEGCGLTVTKPMLTDCPCV